MTQLYIGPVVVLDWTSGLWKASVRRDATPKLQKDGSMKMPAPMFNVTSLWLHGCEETPEYKELQAAVDEVAIARFGKEQYANYIEERKFSSPFRIDIGSKGYDKARFKFLVTSDCFDTRPPAIRDARRRTPEGRPAFITDEREIYPGVLAKVSYSVRAYGGLGSGFDPGAKFDLHNVLKWADGEVLKRGGTDGNEFGDIAAPPADPGAEDADMAALMA